MMKKSVPILLTIIALFGLLSTQANAASFDCKKAATWVEKTVCSNPELSKLDDEMAKAYHDALASLSPEGQKETKQYQKQWLKEISYVKAKNDKFYSEHKEFSNKSSRNTIDDLKKAYEDRIEQLQNAIVKLGERTFRNVYVNHSEADKT